MRRVTRAYGALVAVVAVMLAGSPAAADDAPSIPVSQDAGPLLLVLDASGSMLEDDGSGEQRIRAARRAISTVVGTLPEGTRIGVRVFGSSAADGAGKDACSDSRLVVPVAPVAPDDVVAAVRRVEARGWTPIGYALQRAATDLRDEAGRGTVVLVSDGIDECAPRYGPPPCDVAKEFRDGPVRLRVHTVGFAVDKAARAELRCIAKVTGGRFTDADDADSLARALRVGLLPPPPAPVAPAEPAPVGLLGPVLGVLSAGAAVAGLVAVARAALHRRRRSYW
jgi:Ca-activated chloride channel homolog